MRLEIHRLIIFTEAKLRRRHSEKLRGYIGRMFCDDRLAHNHLTNGNLLYQYPLVQYKVVNGVFLLIGIGKGKEVIIKIFDELDGVNLDGQIVNIESKVLEKYSPVFSISEKKKKYLFLTPWLALNEKNYRKYQKRGCYLERRKLLERILVGNILSASKSLGYTVPDTVNVAITRLKEVNTSLKGNPMLGFLGEFEVNFEIPDYLGIGKSVSRGFGTVRKIK